MDEKDKAQTADERTDAESTAATDTFDPEMEKAFDDEAATNDDGEHTPPAAKKPETPPPPPVEKKEETPPEPPHPEKKEETPPVELTAIQKAEAEGAKLSGEAPTAPTAPAEEKSVLDQLPEGYKDAGEIIQTDTFKGWFDKAPKHIQTLALSGGVDGACAVIDFFRAHVAKEAEKAANAAPAAARRIMAGLGDIEMVQADGTKIKVSEYLKDMGDMGEAIAAIAAQVGGKQSQQPAKPGIEPSRIEKLENELAELRWWEAVTTEHSDARRIIKSQVFKDWAKTASPAIQRLIRSGAVEHTVLALDAFKEVQVAAAKGKQAGSGKDRTIALHSDTVRGKSAEKTKTPDDFDDGFEAGAK
jgi:hypothetical protein